MAKKQLLEDIKAEPTRIFRAPSDVMRDRRFSDSERLEILTAWENIARAAEDGGEETRLNAIVAARAEVESKLSAAKVNGTAVP
jgi:hypothetical protein